jgi:hypothetical protein
LLLPGHDPGRGLGTAELDGRVPLDGLVRRGEGAERAVTARIQWRETEGGIVPVLPDQTDVEVVWAPQPGSQELFLSCPVTEALFEGNRGGGKTLCLLMDFAQHVGQGFGAAWRGILFRREFTQLRDAIDKAIEWFPRLWPEATYHRSEH